MEGWKHRSVGSCCPAYDTTSRPIEEGIHVHLRALQTDRKVVDGTFRSLEIRNWDGMKKPVLVSRSAAIQHMVTSIFGLKTKFVSCPNCKQPHLDEGLLSLHPHRMHICAHCHAIFFDNELGIGNPVKALSQAQSAASGRAKPTFSMLSDQRRYRGGIRLWASNPALFSRNQPLETKGVDMAALGAVDAGGVGPEGVAAVFLQQQPV